MREGEIPVFYGEITNEGRQLPNVIKLTLQEGRL